MKSILLIGFMGAGKSTVGKELSRITGLPLVDLDEKISKKIQMPIHQYFDEFGEKNFRVIESKLLEEFSQQEIILATGGGAVVQMENRTILKKQTTVYLSADSQTLIQRIRADKSHIRPLAQNSTDDQLVKLLVQREQLYQKSANITIYTQGKNQEEIAREILKKLKK